MARDTEAEIHIVPYLKQQLAEQYRFDREAYTDAMDPFIRPLVELTLNQTRSG